MSGKNRLFKSGKTIQLRWDFCRSRISAGFGKSAWFRPKPEPEPKCGTALEICHEASRWSGFVNKQTECIDVWDSDWPSAVASRNSRVLLSPQQVCSAPRPTRLPSVRWSSASSVSLLLPARVHSDRCTTQRPRIVCSLRRLLFTGWDFAVGLLKLSINLEAIVVFSIVIFALSL